MLAPDQGVDLAGGTRCAGTDVVGHLAGLTVQTRPWRLGNRNGVALDPPEEAPYEETRTGPKAPRNGTGVV